MLHRYNGYPEVNAPEYPPDMPPKMLVYHWFSRVKEWDPPTVDSLSLEQLEWIPILEAASDEVSDIIAKQMKAQDKN